MDYWREHAEIAADEAGITGLTEDQLDTIAGVIESAHDFYGQSMGHDVASANLRAEQERERQAGWNAAERERNKIHCKTCDGQGRIITYGGTMQSDSECWKCRGEGRHDP